MTTGAFYPSEGDQRLPRQEATHMSCTTGIQKDCNALHKGKDGGATITLEYGAYQN
jgi:hypothetical protein